MENIIVKTAVKALDEKKATDIKVLKIDDLTVLADYFIICHGTSSTHVKTLADECEYAVEKQGINVKHREGMDARNWVLLDYGDVIIHVYNKETRDFYNLERFWSDSTEIDVNEILGK